MKKLTNRQCTVILLRNLLFASSIVWNRKKEAASKQNYSEKMEESL